MLTIPNQSVYSSVSVAKVRALPVRTGEPCGVHPDGGLPVGFSPQTKDVQAEVLALHLPREWRRDDRWGNRPGCVARAGGGAKCAWILLTGLGHDGPSQGNTAAPERTGEHTRTEAKTRDVSYGSSRGEIRSMGRLENTIGQVGKDCQAGRREGIIHSRERLYLSLQASICAHRSSTTVELGNRSSTSKIYTHIYT